MDNLCDPQNCKVKLNIKNVFQIKNKRKIETYSENGATLFPVFKPSIAFISSLVNSKSKILKFSLIRDSVTDFGIGVVPS